MLLAAPSSSSSSASSVSSFRAWESLSFPCSKPHSAFSKPNIIFLNPNPERFSISSSSSPHPPSPLVASTTLPSSTAPVLKKRKRYRKPYPGESEGIVQEMRFVAMRLRNDAGSGEKEEEEQAGGGWETWQPSMEGFLKYLVDSKLVFETIERIVDESTDVAHVYFRNTGLERAASLSKDLAWFSQRDIMIPKPSNPGTSYATYLSELAEKSVPSFLCHFYNIYFAHITGGQRIGKKVCDMLLEGRELEFYKWDSDVHELLKGTRENLNNLGEHWTRDEKNTCLREAAKSFRYLGQIVRLIILSKWRRAYSALPFSALLLSRLDKLVTGVVSVAPYLTDAAPGPGWNCTTAMEVDNDGISPFSNTNGSHTAGLVS